MTKRKRRGAKQSTRAPRALDATNRREGTASRVAEGSSGDDGARSTDPDDVAGVRARVRNGRLIVDAPTTLPEGTVLDLVIDDEGDDLDDDDRAARDAALLRAWKEAKSGQGQPASKVIDRLRRR